MNSFGETIKKLREERGLPLRTVSAYLDIDQAILSKIERGKRHARRELVIKIAEFFKVEDSDLLISWLSDKIVYEVADEKMALAALQVAEEKLSYKKRPHKTEASFINLITTALENDGRVSAAWLYGSVARGEEKLGSDIDIIVEMNDKKKYSMFDLLDIAYIVEQKTNKKVDLVEKGNLKEFAVESAIADLIKIYG